MALFKILQGKSNNLPTNKVEGYCYVTTDEHKFYVDYKKSDGTLDRFALNAETATKATEDASGNTITKSYLRRYDFWNTGSNNDVDDLRAGITFAYGSSHNAPTTGTIVAFDCKTDESYGLQLMGSYKSKKNNLYFRNHDGDNDQWGDWRTVLDDNNYNLYAPSKTGDGASGTWDISITGNAATADLAQKAVEDNEGNTIDSFYLPLSAGKDKKLTGPLGLTENVNYGTVLPDNGFVGQLFFLEEEDKPSLPTGGTAGQVLVKNSSTDGDAGWATDIAGNAATATKATQDGNGNVISSTYLPLAGGTMNDQAWITWPDTGNWGNSNAGVTFPVQHGGLQWTGQSDWIKIFSEESASDMLDMIMQFGDDGSSALKIRHSDGTDKVKISAAGRIDAVSVYGAVWNDYAEFRICKDDFKPGQVVCENNDDTLNISTHRLQPGANIVSDTYGFVIGETDNAKCPIAVSGRVLAYTYEPREEFNAGDAVCAGPNGTVSKMTREEIREYPERIIGTVSAVPDYEIWGSGNVEVNGRIWIKVM